MTEQIWIQVAEGLWDTVYMSVASTVLAYVIGLPLGVILEVTDSGGLKKNLIINKSLGFIINVLRSVPFLILFVTVIPFTRLVAGTSIGAGATIVPLTIAAAPFVARLTETSLKEVDTGAVEGALACGASPFKIIYKVLIPEAVPSLLNNCAIAFVTVVGYSAMAGFCGGGGLGQLAVNYGYYRNNREVMLVTVAIIVVIVQVFQELGLFLARRNDKRRKNTK